MRSFIIFFMTVILLNTLSNGVDVPTICDIYQTCKCNTTNLSCTTIYDQKPQFIFSNNFTSIHMIDVPIDIINNNTITNTKLQSIIWVSSKITRVETLFQIDLKYLDLSKNNIYNLSDDTFDNCPKLEYIDLSNNKLSFISDKLFLNTKMLETLKLENNLFYSISEKLFKETSNLKKLSIGNPNLTILSNNSLTYLDKLEYLNIENSRIENINKSSFGEHNYLKKILLNNCNHLKSIDNDFIYSIPNIEEIELQNCNIIKFLPPSIVSLKKLKHLDMFGTEIQPSCQNGWFSYWFNETIVISFNKYTDFIDNLGKQNCPAKIVYTSSSITLQLTKKGIINCMAYGNPPPAITWLVPGGLTFHENKEADTNISYHPNAHDWYLSSIDNQSISIDKNGSLHILRMLRTNIGNYTCYVSNKHGNDSNIIEVHLNSEVFFNIKINALLLGITSALGFLTLTILCCVFKLLLIRLNCIKKRKQPTVAEMGTIEKTKSFPEDV